MKPKLQTVDVPQGTIAYREYGASNLDTLVFVHGLFLAGSVWDDAILNLSNSHHCIVLEMPFGGHRTMFNDNADLSLIGTAKLLADIIETLGLQNVTLIGGDFGAVVCKLALARFGQRIGRLVITNCDALEVFPAEGFEYFEKLPSIPGALWITAQAMYRIRALRRGKKSFGAFTHRPIPDEMLLDWIEPMAQRPNNRRDIAKLLRSIDSELTLALPQELAQTAKPIHIIWGADDHLFTLALARRLRAAIGQTAVLSEIPRAKTFVFYDAPEAFAQAIENFEPTEYMTTSANCG